jgi:multicomponent Na+:H+ antiporter subunit C
MEFLLALVVGVLTGGGVYLVMQRHMIRVIFGVVLLSSGVNLLIFTAGRLSRGAPPLIAEAATLPAAGAANALPQALILTAIVIGFGLTSFALVLLLRVYERLGTVTSGQLNTVEHELEVVGAGEQYADPPLPEPSMPQLGEEQR